MLAFLPSPSSGAIHLGPLQLRAYGLCIALGVWAAVVVTSRRYAKRGGDPGLISAIAIWAVPAGIIGARLYSVITDYELYFGKGRHPLDALRIWDGGLGIWGGVLAGVAVGAWVARRHHADVGVLFDCVAPALPLAQAIGRWGNWWNQELFGRPTTLPWGLKIDAAHRPLQFAQYATFHPTFLYESLWDLCVVGIVLLVERRYRLRTGSLLAVYVAAYTFGRFFTEYERIDFAHKIGPLRLNDWTSIVVFLGALTALTVANRRRPVGEDPAALVMSPAAPDAGPTEPAGFPVADPLPPVVEPIPPVAEPIPPVVEPLPPVADAPPPVVEPLPPIAGEPIPPVVEPIPPVVEPLPPVADPLPPVSDAPPPVVEPLPPVADPPPPVVEPRPNVADPLPPVADPPPPVVEPRPNVADPLPPVANPLPVDLDPSPADAGPPPSATEAPPADDERPAEPPTPARWTQPPPMDPE